MNVNMLRQWMEEANRLNLYGGLEGPGSMYAGMNNSGIVGRRTKWAEEMAAKQDATPRQSDVYDPQQQSNAQKIAQGFGTPQYDQEQNALRAFMQPQQTEQYDDAGFPVGRNYGRQVESNGRRSMAENIAMNNAATGGPAMQYQMQQRQIPNELLAMMMRAKPDFYSEDPSSRYAPSPYVRPRFGSQ